MTVPEITADLIPFLEPENETEKVAGIYFDFRCKGGLAQIEEGEEGFEELLHSFFSDIKIRNNTDPNTKGGDSSTEVRNTNKPKVTHSDFSIVIIFDHNNIPRVAGLKVTKTRSKQVENRSTCELETVESSWNSINFCLIDQDDTKIHGMKNGSIADFSTNRINILDPYTQDVNQIPSTIVIDTLEAEELVISKIPGKNIATQSSGLSAIL